MTVIADDAQVHDIGGIMGGEDSGVSDSDHRRDARSRLFHARADRAHRPGAGPDQRRAQPLRARGRSRLPRRRPGDPDRADPRHLRRRGLGRASAPASRRSSSARSRSTSRRTKALGGIDVPEQRQREILESLGFELDGNDVTVPTWRRDVEGPADLVEEVARITGYDKVPSTPLDRAARRRQADRDPRPAGRAQRAPHRRRARARRSGHLELHFRGRGRGLRRRPTGSSPIRSAKR